MKLVLAIAATCLSFNVISDAKAASNDGEILTTTGCTYERQSYQNWLANKEKDHDAEAKSAREMFGVEMQPFSEIVEKLPNEAEFTQRRRDTASQCQRITYSSDGLKVVAYIWKPTKVDGKKLPLIIYNRGGGQELGRLTPTMRDGFYDFVSAGFVVIGSQYRGNDGGDGHDEEGGAEVADVLNLAPLAKSLGYVDLDNVFMLGESRGGMQTFLAVQKGARVNAAAVVGAESDLAANLKRRPELDADYAKQIPDYSANPDAALRRRSAQFWAEDINAPVLMLQGGKDWRVPPMQALGLAETFERQKKRYELLVFDGDDHPLSFHWRERDQRIIDWFKTHMRPVAN